MAGKRTSCWSWIAALALAAGCAGRGSIGTGAGGSGSGPGTGGNNSGSGGTGNGSGTGGSGTGGSVVTEPAPGGLELFSASSCSGSGSHSVGTTPVRRISRIEYNNMVRDLGLDPNGTQPANQFVAEQKIDTGKAGNFNTNTYATVSGTLMNQQYIEAAEGLASAVVANSNTLTNLTGCSTQNATCAQQFITTFATKAFRGQLDSAETTNLDNLYTTVSGKFDFATGIQAVIEAVLTSPRFLFVIEFGQSGGSGAAIPLTPLELATRLSLYLWRSLPDQTLTDAANNGHLANATDVATQATRMLADARAKAALQDFANQWLDIENMDAVTKDTQFKKWSAQVAQDMHTETLTTFAQSVLGNSDYKTLLTSSSSYISANLAMFYGVTGGSPSFNSATTVNTTANPRMGILSQGSVLAAHAHTSVPSPTKRGRLIRQQILCEEVPDPPAAVNGVAIPPPPAMVTSGTTRQAYMTHFSGNGTCAGCHQYMDYIGFGFDNYDATGAYITTENGNMVDPSGQFVPYPGNSTDLSTTFSNMSDMITQLSMSAQVMQCFALEELRYALLRSESDADACSAQQIYQAFMTSGYNLQKLIVAVVSSDSFMYRTPVNAGGACQ